MGPETCDVRYLYTRLMFWELIGRSQFWGGAQGKNGRSKYYKIVMSPCSASEVVSFYCESQILCPYDACRLLLSFRFHAYGTHETS